MAFYKLINDDFRNVNLPKDSVDAIITDPPYLKEYIHLYEDLAIFAKKVLKPGGNLLVLCGQYYFVEILNLMVKHVDYYWILNLYLPGENVRQWGKRIFNTWKPILWFTKGRRTDPKWTPDSVVSNGRDKQHHIWQQNLSAFHDLVKKLTNPEDTILDPFLGAGTTALSAILQGRNFIGIDINPECIEITEKRIKELSKKLEWLNFSIKEEKGEEPILSLKT